MHWTAIDRDIGTKHTSVKCIPWRYPRIIRRVHVYLTKVGVGKILQHCTFSSRQKKLLKASRICITCILQAPCAMRYMHEIINSRWKFAKRTMAVTNFSLAPDLSCRYRPLLAFVSCLIPAVPGLYNTASGCLPVLYSPSLYVYHVCANIMHLSRNRELCAIRKRGVGNSLL